MRIKEMVEDVRLRGVNEQKRMGVVEGGW